jgi:predicted transcriptional regulator
MLSSYYLSFNRYFRTHKIRKQTIYLTDKSKSCLLKHIQISPGMRYRELQRATGFANGVLTYYLMVLEQSRRLKVNRYAARKSTRYYSSNPTAQESRVMEYIRRATTRKILLFLLDHDRCTSDDIMDTKKGASTISWHLSWLRKAGITSVRSWLYQVYRLRNKDLVTILTNKSQKSGISCHVTSKMLSYQIP